MKILYKGDSLCRTQYERFLTAAGGRRVGGGISRDQMQNDETPVKPYETLYSEVHEVYDEIYEPPNDGEYEAEGDTRQTYSETENEETSYAKEIYTTAGKTVEVTNAAGVSKRKDFPTR